MMAAARRAVLPLTSLSHGMQMGEKKGVLCTYPRFDPIDLAMSYPKLE